MKLCIDLNTDIYNCGVTIDRFAHNQMFGKYHSLLTGRMTGISLALRRQRSSKPWMQYAVSFSKISEVKLGSILPMPDRTVD
jgi:hypothetical protein